MSELKINERIVKGLRDASHSNESLAEFLIDIVYEEAEHSGSWWWRDSYKKKIEHYLKENGGSDED